MFRSVVIQVSLVSFFLAETGLAQSAEPPVPVNGSNWPQFRGVQSSGVSTGNPPAEWDVETGKNILWMRPIDGLAHSCPAVWGERIFLTGAVSDRPAEEKTPTGFLNGSGEPVKEDSSWRWQVLCLDLASGAEIWRRSVAYGKPTIKRHLKSSHANSTPATDGKHVVAFFGSEGLFCFDVNGQLLWKQNFGKLHSGPYDAPELEWGFASSPVIHDGKVILQCDCLNTGFVAILDLTTGKEIRRIPREDVATWSTPLVVTTSTETQIVCNGFRQMAGYDLDTGKQLWTLKDGGDVPVPAPLTANGLIYLANGHGLTPAYAISPDARGDLTPGREGEPLPNGLVWWEPRGGAYIPTPIIVGEFLYTCDARGVLTVRKAKTGKPIYLKRVGGQYSASAVATKDRLYLSAENGTVTVIQTGREYKVLSRNKLNDGIFATPAIAGDTLLIRTTKQLYAISALHQDTPKD